MNKNELGELTNALFNIKNPDGQLDIIQSVYSDKHRRTIINCYTQYGKTLSVAEGVCLYLNRHEDVPVYLISPVWDNTKKIRDYVVNLLLRAEPLSSLIDINTRGLERLKTEVSKTKIDFKNGCSLELFSAISSGGTAGSDKGTGLMGFGVDKSDIDNKKAGLIVLDESCRIPKDLYNNYISRMLGPHGRLVEIGNPLHKFNHFYEHWCNPLFNRIKIDYKQGIAEGRLTQEFIDEQKMNLSPMMFKVMYESEFPDSVEDALIPYEWIERNIWKVNTNERWYRDEDGNFTDIESGMDVADGGNDKSVIITGKYKEGIRYVFDVSDREEGDTMKTTAWAKQVLKRNNSEKIAIDANGVGKSVADRLNEDEFPVRYIKGGTEPTTPNNKIIFNKLKDEIYWKLRTAFEYDLIKIPAHSQLIKELSMLRYETLSNEKIRVIKPKDKSPDYADALSYYNYGYKKLVVERADMF